MSYIIKIPSGRWAIPYFSCSVCVNKNILTLEQIKNHLYNLWNRIYKIKQTRSPMQELLAELKEKIIETLDLIDVTPADFNEAEQLVGGKLGIDSIDVLELAMMIDRDYGLKIDNKQLGQKVFATLGTLAEYIHTNRTR
ncbi:MAG: hypothetical protein JW807_09025 [Spirochaetes bacterium]|nr:hypothetical protein [Spirochaetota bacterium]